MLQRNTPDGSIPALMDDLTYTYEGNKLKSVEDASTVSEYLYDFKDHSHQSQEYFYDSNGNMTEDMNKGIEVTYNHLNLPEEIAFEDGNGENKIEYLYDANGVKLSKRVTKNGSLTYDSPRDYVGNFVYAGQVGLELILTQEGVVDVKASQYQYYLKDHLGNTRVMFTKVGTKVETLQENHYYPFGMRFARGNFIANDNKYLYNGKELQDDRFEIAGGEFRYLDWYDYGARFYDVQLGRWHVVDPVSEKYLNYSCYAYVYNNPLLFFDANGEEGYKTTVLNEDGSTTVTFTLKLKIKNSVGMSQAVLESSANAIADQTQMSFTGFDKENSTYYQTVVKLDFNSDVNENDFYIDFVSEVTNEDGDIIFANGRTDEIGNYEKNRFQVLAIGESPSFYHDEMTKEKQPQTGSHELGHGLGLRHEEMGTEESLDGIPVPEVNLMRGWTGGQGLDINIEQLRKIESILPEERN